MDSISSERIEESIRDMLSSCGPEDRIALIETIRSIIDSEMVKTEIEPPEMRCPVCGGSSLIRYGKTNAGTQRYQCKDCGKVHCQIDVGSILGNTKLSYDKWEKYAECFVDHLTCSRVCEKLGICPKTSWFMRARVLEALYSYLPSFQAMPGTGVELDEIYFRESFKGTRFEDLEYAPREPRHERVNSKSGISDDQICVITAFDDKKDFFFDVVCRGALTVNLALDSLKNRICSGAIVNTDRHKAYPKVMKTLKVAAHNAIRSRQADNLSGINKIHQDIRTFMAPFKGVSTKWLPYYLAWYKWLRTFSRNSQVAIRQIVSGNYIHRWREIPKIPIPFRDSAMRPTKC